MPSLTEGTRNTEHTLMVPPNTIMIGSGLSRSTFREGSTIHQTPDDFFLASNSKMPLDLGDFECALCFRLFCKPVTTPCGHTFCRSCILLAIKYNSSCPLCRAKIESLRGSFSVNITVLNLVQKYFKEEYLAREKEEEEELFDQPSVTTKKEMEGLFGWSGGMHEGCLVLLRCTT